MVEPTPVVVPNGPDRGQIWHYGDPFAEQRALARGLDTPAGVWAREALRIAARQPRPELDMIDLADTRLCLIHLDGSADVPLPPLGTELTYQGRPCGRLGTSAQHYELGPVGLGQVRVNIPSGTTITAGSTFGVVDG